MERVGLIALDMDGTLLASDHRTVPERNARAIREACRQGVCVAISTGRMLEDASDFCRRLDLPCMLIAANGARVSDAPLPQGRVLRRCALSPDDALRAIELLRPFGLILNAFEDGRVSTLRDSAPGWTYHLVKRGLICADYGEEAIRAAAGRGIMKLFAVSGGFAGDEGDARIPEALSLLRRELPGLEITSSAPGNVEVMPGDAGKGAALAALAAHLGLTREAVMAVGDAQNDMSMLRYAFHSVAMGNATAEVKAACRYETDTNDECGVGKIIEQALSARASKAGR